MTKCKQMNAKMIGGGAHARAGVRSYSGQLALRAVDFIALR